MAEKKIGIAEIGRWSDAKLLANAELTIDGGQTAGFTSLIFGEGIEQRRHGAARRPVDLRWALVDHRWTSSLA